MLRMTEPTAVKSVRMPASHWSFVAERAEALGITPNAWVTRMVRQQMKLKETKP